MTRARYAACAIWPWTLAVSTLACGNAGSPEPDPDPPGGGQEFVLDFDRFVADVAPVLAANGCDAGGDCHGAGIRGTYELSPQDAKDSSFDFEQTVMQVAPYDLSGSSILRKPLAVEAGGAPHAVKPFATTSDAGYQAILSWLQEGEFR